MKPPLHRIINYSVNVQIVELLLSANANPNLKNKGGNAPLHKAAMWSQTPERIKAIQLLLQYSAQLDDVNNQQKTPLQLLASYYNQNSYAPKIRSNAREIARKMGRLLVWYQYILLPHFIKHVPEKAHACAIASHVALVCAENKTIWS